MAAQHEERQAQRGERRMKERRGGTRRPQLRQETKEMEIIEYQEKIIAKQTTSE